MRLLTATDPIINVPSDKNDRASIEKADLIERPVQRRHLPKRQNHAKPVHYDLVSSLLRYGQFHLAIIDTDDLLNLAQKSNKYMSKAAKKRYEHINKATPYLLEPLDPKCGSAEFDEYGLRAYYRQTSVTYAYCSENLASYQNGNSAHPPIPPLITIIGTWMYITLGLRVWTSRLSAENIICPAFQSWFRAVKAHA